jgi:hypothetical protein
VPRENSIHVKRQQQNLDVEKNSLNGSVESNMRWRLSVFVSVYLPAFISLQLLRFLIRNSQQQQFSLSYAFCACVGVKFLTRNTANEKRALLCVFEADFVIDCNFFLPLRFFYVFLFPER